MYKRKIILWLLILLLLTGCNLQVTYEENSEETDYIENSVTNEETKNNELSLDELLAAVQQSKFISLELFQETGTQTTLPDDDRDYLKSFLTTDYLNPIDYPFLFIPEYGVSCDTGTQFFIMRDSSNSENDLNVLQFAGSEILYSVDRAVSDTLVRILSSTTEDSMLKMQVFANGDTAEDAIKGAVNSYGVYMFALEYFQNRGYSLASMLEDNIFRVDDYYVMDKSQADDNVLKTAKSDPRLIPVMIEYSVKTISKTGDEQWISGAVFSGAIWVYEKNSKIRAYMLGVLEK